MDDNRKIHISDAEDPADFDLEDILAEYRSAAPEEAPEQESLSERSRRLVREQMAKDFAAAGFESLDDVIDQACAEEKAAFAAPEILPAPPEPEPAPEVFLSPAPAEPETDEQADAFETLRLEFSEAGLKDDTGEDYASAEAGSCFPEDEDEEERDLAFRQKREKSEKAKEKLMAPLITAMALLAMHRKEKRERIRRAEQEEEAAAAAKPEPAPEQAVRSWGRIAFSLWRRAFTAGLLCIVMLYLSLAAVSFLPLTGALAVSPRAMALTLMIFEMTVMLLGLDVFTDGVLSCVRGKPDGNTLAAASCLFSLADACTVAVRNDDTLGLPFCAVSAISVTFAILGAFYRARACRSAYRVLTGKNLSGVCCEPKTVGDDAALIRSRRPIKGFITRFEAPDFGDSVFGILAPVLVIASVLLGVLSGFVLGEPRAIPHCISMMSAVSAAFSVFLIAALPLYIASRRFAQCGVAVAGWPGIRDLGRSPTVVVSDTDVFPKGTTELTNIRVLEGAFAEKVISYTGSVISASGCGLAPAFETMIRRNGYTLCRVEHFIPHDGGGLTAVVNGESVCIGGAAFMNLMGIRVPRKLSGKDSVYSAISGALVGIFTVSYRAGAGIREALSTLLESNLEPVFALRDFNITPVLIGGAFEMPADHFRFPSYSERFRISAGAFSPEGSMAAVLSRDGMVPLVEAADRGRKLYTGIRAGTLIAAVGSVFGLLMMFLLCWTGSFETASVGNMLLFMLLWLLPTLFIAWNLRR